MNRILSTPVTSTSSDRLFVRRREWAVALLLAACLVTACGSSGPAVYEQLDPLTSVTTTRAAKPLVLYRDSSARAAYARDYVYLGPIEVNRMGSMSYFLWAAVWGTHSGFLDDPAALGFESIVIYADGEPLLLEHAGWTPAAIGASESVYNKPVASALEVYYPVTVDQVRMLADASDIELRTSSLSEGSYFPWDSEDGSREAFRLFVDHALR